MSARAVGSQGMSGTLNSLLTRHAGGMWPALEVALVKPAARAARGGYREADRVDVDPGELRVRLRARPVTSAGVWLPLALLAFMVALSVGSTIVSFAFFVAFAVSVAAWGLWAVVRWPCEIVLRGREATLHRFGRRPITLDVDTLSWVWRNETHGGAAVLVDEHGARSRELVLATPGEDVSILPELCRAYVAHVTSLAQAS